MLKNTIHIRDMKLITTIIIVLSALSGVAQNRILIVGPKVHVGNGEVIEQGLVGIENGKITLVKNALTFPFKKEEWDTVIEAKFQHLYPAFIAPNSTLGLTEVDAVRATRDFEEVGQLNPHVRSLIAFNVESRVIATVRTNGVLIAQATPRGGLISGTSSVVGLHGWNWEDAAIRVDDGVHVNWPATLQGGGWWAEPTPKKANEKYGEQLRELTDFIVASKAYANAGKKRKFDQRYEAMQQVFNGNKRLYIHADELKALLDIIEFVQEYKIPHPVIVGGYDAYMITEQLRDAKIPVMLPRLHSLPSNEDDPVDLVYRLPKLLQDGGVLFCLENSGDMEAMHARNIPFLAGTARSYGLTEEQAIQSVSINTARILGIDDKYGTIEPGKSASLFISEGDALEPKTSNVTTALFNGEFIPLTNHQIELYEKYKAKYGDVK
jgi:imidazolonepropionase-like amidohydrolase